MSDDNVVAPELPGEPVLNCGDVCRLTKGLQVRTSIQGVVAFQTGCPETPDRLHGEQSVTVEVTKGWSCAKRQGVHPHGIGLQCFSHRRKILGPNRRFDGVEVISDDLFPSRIER